MKLSKLASEIAESPTFALNEEARLLRERFFEVDDDIRSGVSLDAINRYAAEIGKRRAARPERATDVDGHRVGVRDGPAAGVVDLKPHLLRDTGRLIPLVRKAELIVLFIDLVGPFGQIHVADARAPAPTLFGLGLQPQHRPGSQQQVQPPFDGGDEVAQVVGQGGGHLFRPGS